MLKRCVFEARRKEGCESISLTCQPSKTGVLQQQLSACLDNISAWMVANRLHFKLQVNIRTLVFVGASPVSDSDRSNSRPTTERREKGAAWDVVAVLSKCAPPSCCNILTRSHVFIVTCIAGRRRLHVRNALFSWQHAHYILTTSMSHGQNNFRCITTISTKNLRNRGAVHVFRESCRGPTVGPNFICTLMR